jgi:hypothetical protein
MMPSQPSCESSELVDLLQARPSHPPAAGLPPPTAFTCGVVCLGGGMERDCGLDRCVSFLYLLQLLISLSFSFSKWGRHDRAVIRGDHSKQDRPMHHTPHRSVSSLRYPTGLDTDDDALEDAHENAGTRWRRGLRQYTPHSKSQIGVLSLQVLAPC